MYQAWALCGRNIKFRKFVEYICLFDYVMCVSYRRKIAQTYNTVSHYAHCANFLAKYNQSLVRETGDLYADAKMPVEGYHCSM